MTFTEAPKGTRILLIDDSDIVLRVLRGHLKAFGYESVEVMHAAVDAMLYLSSVESPDEIAVDLIICDIEMPGMDGITFCREMKQNPLTAEIPIIIMTANADEESLEAAFEAGAMDYITKPPRKIDLLARIRSAETLKQMLDQRRAMNRRLATANRKLEEMSHTDALTGVYNRRRLDQILETEWRRAMRNGYPLAVLMIDIDRFKHYNDALGHAEGDVCLRTVAQTLRDTLRRAGDVLARYGGEEFMVVLPGADQDAAMTMAEQMRARVEALAIPHPEGVGPNVTITIGVAAHQPCKGDVLSDLLSAADEALYRGKADGRNTVVAGTVG
ncbi:MAG: diguanylate cyclase [Candidatus Dadabacteria bacterium]|nr:MAG: diguanylate cyclase [Candidatus Dadabacteria bacterium]